MLTPSPRYPRTISRKPSRILSLADTEMTLVTERRRSRILTGDEHLPTSLHSLRSASFESSFSQPLGIALDPQPCIPVNISGLVLADTISRHLFPKDVLQWGKAGIEGGSFAKWNLWDVAGRPVDRY
jgi:hypothetical protein